MTTYTTGEDAVAVLAAVLARMRREKLTVKAAVADMGISRTTYYNLVQSASRASPPRRWSATLLRMKEWATVN
jgi:hypothetical protein